MFCVGPCVLRLQDSFTTVVYAPQAGGVPALGGEQRVPLLLADQVQASKAVHMLLGSMPNHGRGILHVVLVYFLIGSAPSSRKTTKHLCRKKHAP